MRHFLRQDAAATLHAGWKPALLFGAVFLAVAPNAVAQPPAVQIVRFTVFAARPVTDVSFVPRANASTQPVVFYPTARSPRYEYHGAMPLRFTDAAGTVVAEATIPADIHDALLLFSQLETNGAPSQNTGKMPVPLRAQSSDTGKMPVPLHAQSSDAGKMPVPLPAQSSDAGKVPVPLRAQSSDAGKMPVPLRYQISVLDDAAARHAAGALAILNLSGLALSGTINAANVTLHAGLNSTVPVGRTAHIMLRTPARNRSYQAYADTVSLKSSQRALLILFPPFYKGSLEVQSRLLVDEPPK